MYLSPIDPTDLLALLRALEWVATDDDGFTCCPLCWSGVAVIDAASPPPTHAPRCRLAETLEALSVWVHTPPTSRALPEG